MLLPLSFGRRFELPQTAPFTGDTLLQPPKKAKSTRQKAQSRKHAATAEQQKQYAVCKNRKGKAMSKFPNTQKC